MPQRNLSAHTMPVDRGMAATTRSRAVFVGHQTHDYQYSDGLLVIAIQRQVVPKINDHQIQKVMPNIS
jgi:hypothetical protein